jgi:hypothetical protein
MPGTLRRVAPRVAAGIAERVCSTRTAGHPPRVLFTQRWPDLSIPSRYLDAAVRRMPAYPRRSTSFACSTCPAAHRSRRVTMRTSPGSSLCSRHSPSSSSQRGLGQFRRYLAIARRRDAEIAFAGGSFILHLPLWSLYSITSSARSRIDVGSVNPSVLAVLTFTNSSNLVGCTTGRSAGFAPLRILPV